MQFRLKSVRRQEAGGRRHSRKFVHPAPSPGTALFYSPVRDLPPFFSSYYLPPTNLQITSFYQSHTTFLLPISSYGSLTNILKRSSYQYPTTFLLPISSYHSPKNLLIRSSFQISSYHSPTNILLPSSFQSPTHFLSSSPDPSPSLLFPAPSHSI